MREGREIKVPKFITGGAAGAPIKAEVAGIRIKAPPPPEMVEMTKAKTPNTNKLARCQSGMDSISVTKSMINSMGVWPL